MQPAGRVFETPDLTQCIGVSYVRHYFMVSGSVCSDSSRNSSYSNFFRSEELPTKASLPSKPILRDDACPGGLLRHPRSVLDGLR
jgi:hypothetical protein